MTRSSPARCLAELSFLLGFSDPNSLHRAFKRWEGMTPMQYRRSVRATAIKREQDRAAEPDEDGQKKRWA